MCHKIFFSLKSHWTHPLTPGVDSQGGCGWEQLISLLVISNLKLPAGSPADYTALCRVATRAAAAVVFAGYEIIFISPPLRCGEIFHYFCAADYLRLQPFSLINKFIFRENTPISQIVCRLWDITISYSREKFLPGLCR